MVATLVAEELQLAVVVMLCVLPSLNVPIAVKDWNVLTAIVGLAGLIASESSVA